MRGKRLGNTANPLIIVQWIIAISSVVGGAYVASPFLQYSVDINGKSAFLQTATADLGILIFGVLFLLTGVVMIAGIVFRKVRLRSIGLFFNGLGRLYVLIATFLAQGLLPLTWLSNAVIMVLVFYIWGRIRKRGVE